MISNFILFLGRKWREFLLWLNRRLLGLDRGLVGKSWKQLAIVFALFFVVLLGITSVYTLFNTFFAKNGRFEYNIHQAFVDMTNPETVRHYVYDSIPSDINNTGQIKTVTQSYFEKPSFLKVFLFAVVYVFGAIFFTGLLIATVTNIWRARSDKFRRGAVKYRFEGHIVFLGYNNLIAGMIQKICEKEAAHIEDVRIVVGVEDNASVVCDKIKNRLFDDYRDQIVVLKADSCNRKDLERLSITYAKEVYIIGEHDDAYNLKCYRTIYELSLCEHSREIRMPKCYVNLQSQATLTLFRTYASAGELGVDFSNFHSFSFYDEWARTMIQENWTCIDKAQEHFIIAGMTEMGIALARKIALLCHNPNNDYQTIITFIDNQIYIKSKHFIIQHQDLFDHCQYRIHTKEGNLTCRPINDSSPINIEFEFVEGNISDDSVRQSILKVLSNENLSTTIALCYDDSQNNLSLGLCLPSNVYENNDARIWIYQPTLGDLGKYLKGQHYKNVITFGMSGAKLDIRNEENTSRAKLINHYFLHKDCQTIDYSNSFLIQKEWERLDIAKQWSYIRFAEFIPLLSQYDSISTKIVMMHNRAVVDYFMFGMPLLNNQVESLKSINEKFVNAIIIINNIVAKESTN